MSTLIVHLPPRPRHGSSLQAPGHWRYAWTGEGLQTARVGVAATDLLPKADSLIAVVPAADLAWHRLTLPKAPAARMRAALIGALEEQLLDDAEALHLALPPAAAAGSPTWVAVVHKPWLQRLIQALEVSGRSVERIVPAVEPAVEGGLRLHFHAMAPGTPEGAGEALPPEATPSSEMAEPHPWIDLASADGACQMRLQGTLAAAVVRRELAASAGSCKVTATPPAAAAAEAWLDSLGTDARVHLVSDAERLAEVARSSWNLRQFELLPQVRGTRLLREGLRRLAGPAWRPLRWGVAALLVVQLAGLNIQAWQQQRELEGRRAQQTDLLKATHPQVRVVLDAAAQMQSETERLRTASGRASAADFDALLAAAGATWPAGLAPAQQLRFDGSTLQLSTPGATEAHAAALRERLRPMALDARLQDGRLQLQRAGSGR